MAMADLALFAAALPFALWATWSDLKYMKIPNLLVMIMAATFVVVGAVVLPFDVYLWRLVTGFGVLVVGFTLFSLGLTGGGDAKFAAAMALFVSHDDWLLFMVILSVAVLLAVFLHRVTGKLAFARPLTDSWESWGNKQKFPLGLGMGAALIVYLGLRAFG